MFGKKKKVTQEIYIHNTYLNISDRSLQSNMMSLKTIQIIFWNFGELDM